MFGNQENVAAMGVGSCCLNVRSSNSKASICHSKAKTTWRSKRWLREKYCPSCVSLIWQILLRWVPKIIQPNTLHDNTIVKRAHYHLPSFSMPQLIYWGANRHVAKNGSVSSLKDNNVWDLLRLLLRLLARWEDCERKTHWRRSSGDWETR